MPEFGTQVYWHEIPNCPPPWNSEKDQQHMWRIGRSVIGNISDMRHLSSPSLSEVIMRRHYERNLKPTSNLHWGIILEPYLSPLHGLNMVMKELGAATISCEEAADAVAAVEKDYSLMTQQQPSQSQDKKNICSKGETGTQQSSGTAMDIKVAPLLEVFKLFCLGRGLHVSTFSRSELRLKGRIGLADVLPRRRVVLAFDCSKPLFVFMMAAEARRNRSTKALQSRYIQIVAPTSNPFPWRRIVKNIGYLPPSECVVVAVQRQHDDYETDDFPRVGESDMHGGEYLLGGDEDDIHDEEVVKTAPENEREWEGSQERRKRSRSHDEDGETESSETEESSLSCESYMAYEKIRLGPNPIFKAEDQLCDDPLFDTPVAVLRKTTRRTQVVHDWIQRLVDWKERKKLYSISHLQS